MKKKVVLLFSLLAFCVLYSTDAVTQDARQLLTKVDEIMNAPQDQELLISITIIDRRGNQSNRELVLLQKGSDKRLVRFLSPADQKGIAFLSLPNDNLTMYMPAFGRTRRVAGHVKHTNFAGTDYTYEDMEAKKYMDKYVPSLLRDAGNVYVLELKTRDGIRSDYSKLHMTIRKSDNYPLKIDYFDRRGNNVKRMTSQQIRDVSGYKIAHRTIMEDLRGGSKTIMEIKSAEFDNNLSDDIFTERYMTR